AALSHELRNPLNPVLMGASALEDDFDLPGDTREIISMIRRNVELEARLIDDLLDITSLSRGRLKIEPIIADIHSLVRLVENILRSDMNVKGIELILKLEAEEHHL